MKEISKERAEELDAAWNAATDTQRLSMNRMSWFGADTVTYYEETPSKLELKAAARIEKLEAALGEIAANTYGTELTNSDAENNDILGRHLVRFQKIAREALAG